MITALYWICAAIGGFAILTAVIVGLILWGAFISRIVDRIENQARLRRFECAMCRSNRRQRDTTWDPGAGGI